jgi:hypothetical protein
VTELLVFVIDVFKLHARGVSAGATLFLRWDDRLQQFWISYLENGAFQVIDGSLVRPRPRDFDAAWPERDAEALAGTLRKRGPSPPSS